jgi:pyruvate formate lyase activating enzyme
MLKDLIGRKLVDYVAMDIKTPEDKYPVVFAEANNLEDIKKSVEILKRGEVDFEFRTTVVSSVHYKEDFNRIAEWIGGENVKYFLQNFRPEKTINPEFEKISPFKDAWLQEVVDQIKQLFKECKLR